MNNAMLMLENVSKSYAGKHAVSCINLTISRGEILCLVGPSGSGKTTLLRVVAGLEHLNEGRVVINGETMASEGRHVNPEKRALGMVFQDYALWPHLKVLDNVSVPLRETGEKQWGKKAIEALNQVGLSGLEKRYPFELSGGQQQRVALARAIAGRPRLLLFDEPLSNLDAKLRDELREVIAQCVREAELAALYITHDQNEAFFLADRMGVMRDGELIQLASPEFLYGKPSDAFVAHFTGAAGPYQISVSDNKIYWNAQVLPKPDHLNYQGDGYLYLRPRSLRPVSASGVNTIRAQVIVSGFAGGGWSTLVQLPEGRLYLMLDRRCAPDEWLTLEIQWEQVFIFDCHHGSENKPS